MTDAPSSVAMLFPTRVGQTRYRERLAIDDGKQRSSKRHADAKHQIVERRAGSATVSRQDFQLPLFDSRPLGVINGVCPVYANDLGRGVANHSVDEDEGLPSFCPAGSCFIDPLLGCVRFCHGRKKIIPLLVVLWQDRACIAETLFKGLKVTDHRRWELEPIDIRFPKSEIRSPQDTFQLPCRGYGQSS